MSVRAALVALVLSLVMAGCGGDPEPKIAPTPTTAPTTPEPTESSAPAAEADPEEAVRGWAQADVSMQNSGDSSTYRGATKGCQVCQAYADTIDGYYAAGGSVRTGPSKVVRIKERSASGALITYAVTLDPDTTVYTTASAAPAQQLAGDELDFRVTVRERNGTWRVFDYAQLAR